MLMEIMLCLLLVVSPSCPHLFHSCLLFNPISSFFFFPFPHLPLSFVSSPFPTPILVPYKVRGVKKKYITENNKKRRWTETHVILKLPVSASPNNVGLNERLNFHFSLSCTGEGNGNPLQCSCLENPRDGGAWSAVVYGVAQGRTQLT